ncbi:MAG: fluoride efflux transporter CrcB [Planctomycetaceae bacterium]|jgi:CrcB protein|nr:fluoride efflux transporter CrcB [Planctomycetaceae bacterium]MDP7277598.1 fluoride efflux transporter CrcB [Planctomycetaceae bacterium]
MHNLLAVGLGGFVGAVARWGLGGFVHSRLGDRFPWGTLTVNVLGCLLIGFVLDWAAHREGVSETTRLFLVTGILGSLTTFSTFGYETIGLFRQGSTVAALGNIGLNVVVGLIAVLAGLMVARSIG